jgi:alpha-galactosidase
MNTAQKHFFIYDKIEIDPYKTKIYAEGWQSWSVAETLNIGEIPYRATDPDSRIIDCQNSVIAGEGIFQGSGLLGIQIQDSGPIYLYHLNNLTDNIPIIRAKKDGNYLIISTDGSITHQYFDSNEEPESALKLFAENFIHNVLPEKSTFFKKEITIPAIWCTWYGYYDKVIPQNIYDNMTIIENNNLSIDIIQIDDGYQLHAGDWLYPSANFTNNALEKLAKDITASGKIPGIWLAPTIVSKKTC